MPKTAIMKNLYMKFVAVASKGVLLVLMTCFGVFSASAQTIDVAAMEPDRPDPLSTYYTGSTNEITFTTTGSFATGTTFYLYYNAFEEDNVLGELSADGTFNFTWPSSSVGTESFNIRGATGSFDAETVDILEGDLSFVGGTVDNATDIFGNDYDFTGTGLRRVTSQAINTDYTEEVTLNLSIYDLNAVVDRPLKVQFSTDGTTYADMTDTNADDEWFGVGVRNLQFVLTSGQKNATTYFRVIQENSNALTANDESWYLDDDISLEVGGIVAEATTFIANYTIDLPSITTTTFNDDGGSPVGTYFAGQSVEVEGAFAGEVDQVDDFNYTVVFRYMDERFQLENVADANVGNTITVSGTIPTDVTLDENWTVTIEAYTGADAVFGLTEEFSSSFPTPFNLDDLTVTGGTQSSSFDPFVFTDDGDRYAMTPELDVQSTDNSSVSFSLAKVSAGIAPSGSEIVLEYTTDGTTFTQIGADIDLNGDLSEAVMISPLVAGAISGTTQFRIRQLSNNGADLSTWSLDDLEITTGGTILVDDDLVDYIGSSIDVDGPTVVLDPVNVPDGLIYPGSSVDVTYNITNGAFGAGTTFDLILDNGIFVFTIGEATAITPGAGEDHTASITVPALVGGSYDIQMVASGNEVTSNVVALPVYNTTIEISDITSNSGVQVGGEDLIFPGSEITVNYTTDGDIGAGAELMLEVRDYGKDVSDNDGYELVSAETGLDGTIVGTLPTGIDFDDDGSDSPYIRIKVGNGMLAQASVEFVQDENGDNISGDTYSDLVVDLDLTEGNDPTDEDVFIGSGQRSATTLAFDFALGGSIDLSLTHFDNYNGTPQDVYLQASTDDGATWTSIGDEEYSGGNVFFTENIPQEMRSASTRLRFIYNMNGEAEEFENQLRFNYITLRTSTLAQANTDVENISSQFDKPTVSLEVLDSYNFVAGEEFTVEYTTSGPFPANTAFAIVLAGPDGLETVVGESSALGTASVDVTMPAFVFEDNPTDTDDLYDELKVVAFNKETSETTYTADETMVIDMDEYFITIEGTDDEDGNYYFDEAGDRSLLTQAFDLSSAENVSLNFTFYDIGIDPTDNQMTIPVLQVSTDGGATFQNIAAEEDGILGDGYLFNNTSYSAELPSSAITAATHFRWYQPLNLGAYTNQWGVYAISIVLEQGNEISTFYTANNSGTASTLAHPSLSDFEWAQDNAETEAVFNGEDFTYSWDQVFETSDDFPAGTQFDFILHDGSDFVIDPDTNRPFVVASTASLGSGLSASVPFFLEEGSYSVRLIASIPWEDGETYFYAGDENGESTQVAGSLDVFLRAVRTTFEFNENEVFYAGNQATFSIAFENEEQTIDASTLYANLVAKNFSGVNDLILATQLGVADMVVDLPPHLNGTYNFEVRLSEGAALGAVGDLIDVDSPEDGEMLTPLDFISGNFVTLIETNDFYEYSFPSQDVNRNLEFDYDVDAVLAASGVANERLRFQYSTDGGNNWSTYTSWSSTSGSYSVNLSNFLTNGYNIPSGTYWERVRFRWIAYDPWTPPYGPQARGTQIEISNVDVVGWTSGLENDMFYFPDGGSTSGPSFSDDIGRGLITTRDLLPEELESATLVSFDFTFGEVLDDIGADQAVVFEYSTDGGAMYTELEAIPSQELYDDEFGGVQTVLSEQNFLFEVTSDMKDNGARFRFRQEERNGIDVSISNFQTLFGSQLPFEYISDNRSISSQAILVAGISSTEGCLEDDIVIDYEIRGTLGAENIITARYEEVGNSSNADDFSLEMNATSGTGQMTVKLPSEVFGDDENNKYFRFGLAYDDDTNDDHNFDREGALSELQMEIVAPIYEDAYYYVNSGNNLECEGEDVTIYLSNPRDHFMYEILNETDGTVLGSLTYDPEDPENELSIGVVTEGVDLQLRVTSFSSSGLECNSRISTVSQDVDFLENYELNVNDGSGYVLVESGDGKTICEDASADATLRVYRPNGSLGTSGIEWFRDDLNTPVSVGTSYQVTNAELSEAGSYFARITDGSCSYLTESFVITNIAAPDMPEITVVSGNLGTCEGDGEVVLAATEGYTYYSWSNGETTQEITVDEEGSYTVQVSNAPFEVGCSVTSEAVELETTYSQEFTLRSSTQGVFLLGGETVNDCNATTIQFYDDTYSSSMGANGGIYTIYRDGVAFKTATGSSTSIDESGSYHVEWTDDALNGVCTTTSPTFNVVIFESVEEAPAITVVSGDLLFCEGDGEVVLSAPDGFDFYEWSGGSIDGSGAQTVTVTEGGTYSVEVSNLPFGEGCSSPSSAPVVVREVSSPEFFVRTDTDGNDEDNIVNEGTQLESCDSEFIYFFEDNSYANNGTVVLFRDGVEYASIFDRSFEITESGTYTAEKRSDDINISCVRNIGDFTVTINVAPTAVPVLTATGDLEFCTNEGNSVLLTAPAGFEVYNWFRNGGSISSNTTGFDATSNTLEVIEGGTYSVQVGNVTSCYSPVSNIITVSTKNLPGIPNPSQQDATCGPGPVTFSFNGDNLYSYQLINAMTGQPSGNPVVGGDSFNSYITSESISEETPFYLEVSYADGSGCSTFDEFRTFTGEPNNVNLELDGNTLEAVLANYSGYSEIRWYRNGTELKNRVNSTSINITDAATYSIEVDFEGVGLCTVTSNSIDLGAAPSGRGRQSETSIDATTYPNPVVSSVNIKIEDESLGEFEVKIMTLSGQVVLADRFENEEGDESHSISVEGLQSGIYTLTIRQEGRVTSKRIFIQ